MPLGQVSFVTNKTNQTLVNLNEIKPVGAGNYGELLFWTKSSFGWVGSSAAPTGWILLLILCIMVFFALPFIRRKGYFQVRFKWLLSWLTIFLIMVIFSCFILRIGCTCSITLFWFFMRRFSGNGLSGRVC